MHETGKKLLNLMFRQGETVCVSYNKFGYYSVPLERALDGIVTLVPTEDSVAQRKMTMEDAIEKMDTSTLTLVALNPIKGYRLDQNCYAYRNFLVEMDFGPLPEQLAYIKKIGMPYSAVVFSGNKSLHFLISLDSDLPSEKVWRTLSEWTLNIATIADQNTKNPSRSIRIPGSFREAGKKQLLVEFKGAVKLEDFTNWLALHPEAKPKERTVNPRSENKNFDRVKSWVAYALKNGLDPRKSRNKQWFSIACEFALAGYSEEYTMDVLSNFFVADRTFKEKEWETTIRSAFKYIYDRK